MHVVVERSRAKGLAAVLGCGLFIVASLAVIALGSAIYFVVGAVCLLTSAGFGIGWIVLLLRPGPGLVVDDAGFDDRSSLGVAVGRVLWADVTSVSHRSVFTTSYVVVNVRVPGTRPSGDLVAGRPPRAVFCDRVPIYRAMTWLDLADC